MRRKSAILPANAPDSQILVIVHPGSACGSADFNYGNRTTAEIYREALIREWRNWRGGVVVIDSALSDELPGYPHLKAALDNLLVRAAAAGRPAIRTRANDPKQNLAIGTLLRKWKLPKDQAQFLVTGAWHYPDDRGCVGGVCRTIRALDYRAEISPAALAG